MFLSAVVVPVNITSQEHESCISASPEVLLLCVGAMHLQKHFAKEERRNDKVLDAICLPDSP